MTSSLRRRACGSWRANAVGGLWSAGHLELLNHRLRAFTGGMSPVVSLAWLAAAFFFWLVLELKRQVVRERHKAPWPLGDDFAPALAGARRHAQRLSYLLKKTVPRGYGALAAVIVAAPGVMLFARLQPIGESRLYGRIFVVLCTISTRCGWWHTCAKSSCSCVIR